MDCLGPCFCFAVAWFLACHGLRVLLLLLLAAMCWSFKHGHVRYPVRRVPFGSKRIWSATSTPEQAPKRLDSGLSMCSNKQHTSSAGRMHCEFVAAQATRSVQLTLVGDQPLGETYGDAGLGSAEWICSRVPDKISGWLFQARASESMNIGIVGDWTKHLDVGFERGWWSTRRQPIRPKM
ncbi:hypothetical protein QBC43DRAFT_337420 [Cladorrhinum sp. PSN259]|nr:hypothetical protein QBC43DRAFT_337420 [Cladorrhinum sp. PSN259]